MEDRESITSRLIAVGISATVIVAGFLFYQNIDSKSGSSDLVVKLDEKGDAIGDGDMVTKEVTRGARIGDTVVSPRVSPVLALSPSVSPRVSPLLSPVPSIASTIRISPTVSVIPSSTPLRVSPTPLTVSPSISPTPTIVTVTPSPSVSPLVTPTPVPVPSTDKPAAHVVINEIAWMGTVANSTDEWIELYNPTDAEVSLSGWILKSETDDSPHIVLTGKIQANGYYLIERSVDDETTDIVADLAVAFGAGLKNTGERLILQDSGGNVINIDTVDGSSSWFNKGMASPDYKSMERIDPDKSGSDSNNWATNNNSARNGHDADGNSINGTPGQRNSVQI